MNELFEYLKQNGDSGWGFDADNAVYSAVKAGLVKEAKLVASMETDTRRWGRDTIYVYELDGQLVGIDVYVMYSENGENEVNGIYEVEPYGYTETRYRKRES
jgi:hypothetical protein